jgi:dicarboxylate/amino acid:cation (Na+ or H+) symporter, DAACS family
MFIGFAAGTLAGIAAHQFLRDSTVLSEFIKWVAQPAGRIFLRLLLMLVVPLLFSALALGIAGLGDLRRLGRVGLWTLAYTVVISAVAVLLGIVLVSTLRPGEGVSAETRARLLVGAAARSATVTPSAAPATAVDFIVQIVPANPVRAAADGDMLAVMLFSLMVGVGIALTRSAAARQFEECLKGLYEVTLRLIHLVIGLAPYGVAALMFTLTAQLGYEVLWQLGRYVGVVLVGLALHQFVVYSLAVRLLGGMSPRRFFRDVREAMLMAFSTASSNATLPTALEVAEQRLRLPPEISRFVLTIGATANQNGTALFEGVTVLFLAQFYGVELSFGQQVAVAAICVVGGIGTAGVPAGSLPVVAMILGLVNIPAEGIGLILGVDRLLDMCRTTLNVTGDLAAAVVVSARAGNAEPYSVVPQRDIASETQTPSQA